MSLTSVSEEGARFVNLLRLLPAFRIRVRQVQIASKHRAFQAGFIKFLPDSARVFVCQFLRCVFHGEIIQHLAQRQVDAGKALDVTASKLDLLTKLVDNVPKMTLKRAYTTNKRFNTAVNSSNEFKRLYASVFRSSEKHLKVVLALYDSKEGLTREQFNDGDYEIYSDHEFRKIDEYQAKDWPFKFWIYEKESGNFVGTAGVHSIDEERKCADADWYILKPYRGRGYGKEAFLAVAKNLFDGKLPEYKALARYNTYRRYYPKINLIKAYIQEDNAPSRALAESCGFRHAYTDTRYFYLEDSKQIKNAAVYELAP